MNKQFNGECQTRGCKGNLKVVHGYVYNEQQPSGKNPWDVKNVKEHVIDVYQCEKCKRVHGEVVESTGITIEFFGATNSASVSFQTPSHFGGREEVCTPSKQLEC